VSGRPVLNRRTIDRQTTQLHRGQYGLQRTGSEPSDQSGDNARSERGDENPVCTVGGRSQPGRRLLFSGGGQAQEQLAFRGIRLNCRDLVV
jgi:hypothetical protein